MKFFDHKVPNSVLSGKGTSWDSWLSNELAKLHKQANEAKPECEDDSRGACRGQVINTDNENGSGYQKGESVTGKKEQGGNARKDTGGTTDQNKNKQKDKEASAPVSKEANCGKEMGKCDGAGKVTEKHYPAGSTESGSEKKKGNTVKQDINNDPNYQKGESTNLSKGKKKSTKKSARVLKFEKISAMSDEKRKALFAHLSVARYSLPPSAMLHYAEAISGIKYSNLKDDEKKWFKDFWEVLFPSDYVAEMVKDR